MFEIDFKIRCVVLCFAFLWISSMTEEAIKRTTCTSKPLKCGINEVRNDCYSPCETRCATRFRSDGMMCTADCRIGCSCKEGYLRHDNQTCVPISQCSPPLCNKDEVYKECGTRCEVNCKTYGNTCLSCTKECVEGCFCMKDLVRESPTSLTCIDPSKCSRTCPGKYEFFDNCPDNCPPTQNCSVIWSRYGCPNSANKCCEPQCRCKSGYYRGKDQTCITLKQCMAERNKNEV